MFFTIKGATCKQSYVFYTLQDMRQAGRVEHVGVVRLADLTAFNDVTLRDTDYMVNIVDIGTEPLVVAQKAMNYAASIQRQDLMNHVQRTVQGWQNPQRGQPVICNETGERFTSARHAASAHSLTYSQLVGHLKGEVGYKTVKGRTYTRINK